MDDSMRHFKGHGGKWTRWCVWDIFKEMGYEMHQQDWGKSLRYNGEPYDVVFGVQHLHNVMNAIGPDTLKMLRTSTMSPVEHNRITRARVSGVNERRCASIKVRRLQGHAENIYKAIEIADYVVGNGNDYIRNTYPERLRNKMHMMDVTRAYTGNITPRAEIPQEREWLWHFGSGAIHKGLDLCIEVFARHPELTLHITGNLSHEPDVFKEFRHELSLPNIHYHGWQAVSGGRFKSIVDRCVGFIGATCSEGQSPAVATCISLGLYPVISRQSGIDLIDGCGLYLDALTIDDVEDKVHYVMNMTDGEILEQVEQLQADALVRYSQDTFRKNMKRHIERALHGKS